MNILISNDDGVFAPGIMALAVELSKNNNVIVVAPDRQCSGNGHSITFFDSLFYEKVDYPNNIDAFKVNGTPSDCVKFGLDVVCKNFQIDAVISGINDCLNIGTDVFYSGTTNAAIEGTICGIKSVAVSTISKKDDFSFPAKFVAKNLAKFLSFASESITVNVNIPSIDKASIKGVVVTELGRRRYDDRYELLETSEDKKRYILTGLPVDESKSEHSHDVAMADKGYITITPLTLFTTDHKALKTMKNEEFEL